MKLKKGDGVESWEQSEIEKRGRGGVLKIEYWEWRSSTKLRVQREKERGRGSCLCVDAGNCLLAKNHKLIRSITRVTRKGEGWNVNGRE